MNMQSEGPAETTAAAAATTGTAAATTGTAAATTGTAAATTGNAAATTGTAATDEIPAPVEAENIEAVLPEDAARGQHAPTGRIVTIRSRIWEFCRQHCRWLVRFLIVMVALLYLVFFVFALQYSIKKNIGLIVLTVIMSIYILYRLLETRILNFARRCWEPVKTRATIARKYGRWVLWGLCGVAALVLIVIFSVQDVRGLYSAAGVLAFIFIMFIFSANPAKAEWRVLFGGLVLQIILGLIILRWYHGSVAFRWLGDQMTGFLGHGAVGANFLFGPKEYLHEFSLLVMPTAIYFAAFAEICYYYGILQYIIRTFGTAMNLVMSVGPAEAMVAATNIFLDPVSSVLTVAPLMRDMPLAQLHSVMTSGFASVSGTLLAIYLSFGIPANLLITASVLSAPAALAASHMMYPADVEPDLAQNLRFPETKCHNPFHALIEGSKAGLTVVVHVIINLLSFVALLAFLNALLTWFGHRLGVDVSLEMMMSYIFLPFAYAMGVEQNDAFQVSRLIGIRLFLTEIVGYQQLGILMDNRLAGLEPHISPRSEVIATFALCGFGTFPDIAINLGAIGAVVPNRKNDLSKLALRAMLAGNIACYMTACIAGILYVE